MHNKKSPLLTIHVSVFNLEKYIAQCLDSILGQDFDDYELILVDNGSTDRSIEICESYAEKYPDKIIYKKFPLPTIIGRPYFYAQNTMKGEYFISIDGDDYITPGSLRRIANILNSARPDIIMGTFICDPEPGCPSFNDASFDSKRINGVPYTEAIEYLSEIPNFHTVQWRYIISRRINKVKGKFEEEYSNNLKNFGNLIEVCAFGDVLNVLRLLAKADSIVFMEDPFYVYRSRPKSISSVHTGDKQAVGILAALILLGSSDELLFKHSAVKVESILKSQLRKFSWLYSNICTTMTFEGYKKLEGLLTSYFKQFYRLKEYGIDELDELCDLVAAHGAYNGLVEYTGVQEERLRAEVRRNVEKDYFVFPTGICGESTMKLLERWGVNIRGFLDNDRSKSSLKFCSYPCMHPDTLKNYSIEQLNNTVVIIATSYRSLIPILTKQLKDMGISDNQIIVRNGNYVCEECLL